jgi:hypothetical protein
VASFASASTQVVASVTAVGGLPPYTYTWGGSDAIVSSNTGPSITYTPAVRLSPPLVGIALVGGTTPVAISWAWPSPGFVLQATPNLLLPFTNVTATVQTNTGVNVVMLNDNSQAMFFRVALAGGTLAETDTVSVIVTDANGVSVQTNMSLAVQAVPIPFGSADPPIAYGLESPYDPGLGTLDRVGFQFTMATPGAGAGVRRFNWIGWFSQPGDFIEPPIKGVLPPAPWYNGDADVANCGVDSVDMMFYVGHGSPWSISFTFPVGPISAEPVSTLWSPILPNTESVQTFFGPVYFNVPYGGGGINPSWGTVGPNDTLEWLCLLSCEVLQPVSYGYTAPQRWFPAFNGLHIMTGFRTTANARTGFPVEYAANLLGIGRAPMSINKAWFAAAMKRNWQWDPIHGGTGRAAAMGPVRFVGGLPISDFNDYYWGKGGVGPNITAGQINGFWMIWQ